MRRIKCWTFSLKLQQGSNASNTQKVEQHFLGKCYWEVFSRIPNQSRQMISHYLKIPAPEMGSEKSRSEVMIT